ncbi:MAG: hypothetical protein LAT64_04140 [Phycisphaerales bacterium]|nr:hypothetical protein [Planctomycetota bacterium]MCH8507942.1 hypothetical protein [Phycisphaerales bacterium]
MRAEQRHTKHTPKARRATDPRDAAMRVLARHAERMPDLSPVDPDTAGMDPRDAALCHAVIDASLRRWFTLSYLIEQAAGRDIRDTEPRMQAALVAGAAQLLLFDRIPDHAAIDETVEWAKRRIRPGAAGMVNAVLRRIAGVRGEVIPDWQDRPDAIPLSGGDALTLREIRLPEDPTYRLVIACSLPGGLLESWSSLGADLRSLALHTLIHPPTVCLTADDPGIGDDPRFIPHDTPGHSVFIGERSELGRALQEHPRIWVQDAAASGVVSGLEPGGETVVVDLCAGRGTKTRQLLRAFPHARIVAAEVDADRMDALRHAFKDEPRVEVAHAEHLAERGAGWADLVLADVPCSNSGVLARRTEARYRVRSVAMDRMLSTQREILGSARAMLRPGGRLVYSTCSLEREENQDQAAWAAHELGLALERERAILPAGEPGGPDSAYRDGSYAAELRA